MQSVDPLLAFARALPAGWLTTPEIPNVIKRLAEAAPETWLAPIDTATAAAMAGMTPAALKQARWRAQSTGQPDLHPESWCEHSKRYAGGRLAVLRWVHARAERGDAA